MPDLTYRTPNEIDGEPDEVRRIVLDQLEDLITAVTIVALQTKVQLRSAAMSAMLDIQPSLTPEELNEAWDMHEDHAQIARIVGAIETAGSLATQLKESYNA